MQGRIFSIVALTMSSSTPDPVSWFWSNKHIYYYYVDSSGTKHHVPLEEASSGRWLSSKDRAACDALLFSRDLGLFDDSIAVNNEYGKCPICLHSLSYSPSDAVIITCCGALMCTGCSVAYHNSQAGSTFRCPLCRGCQPTNLADVARILEEDVEKSTNTNNIVKLAVLRFRMGDVKGSLVLFEMAAEMGDTQSHFMLSKLYSKIPPAVLKFLEHSIAAAIGGHPLARIDLAEFESKCDRDERAVKHYRIAAAQGSKVACDRLLAYYKIGLVDKMDLEQALRAQQAAELELGRRPSW